MGQSNERNVVVTIGKTIRDELFLGIDQGSSSTKGLLLDQAGKTVAEWAAPVPEIHRSGRCVEQDPEGLLVSVRQIFAQAKQAAAEDGRKLRAWGLSVQRSGVLAWHSETGQVLHPMITWADTRAQPIVDAFGRGRERISTQTGLPVLANFAGPKIHLLQHQFLDPKVYVATLDSYLVHALSDLSVFATEDTMAARTMLYAVQQRGWSEELCRQFQVDQRRLPPILGSLSKRTTVEDVPLMACLGDQQAALLGRYNTAKRPLLNLGTIASLTVATGATIANKPAVKASVLYSRTIANSLEREVLFIAESTSTVTGAVLLEPLRRQWCSDTREISELCNRAYQENPAGLATAYWVNNEAPSDVWPQGVPNVTVCKPGATEIDRVRAVVENVGNIIVRMLEEFAEKGLLGDCFPAQIDVAGGCSELDYLMQYIADVSGHTLHKLPSREAGARGAALAALISVDPSLDIRTLNDMPGTTTYQCQSPDRRKRYQMWQRMEQDVLSNRLPAHAEIER
jgi:glycerol kinase